MAENRFNKETAADKVSGYLSRNRVPVVVVAVVVIAAILAYAVTMTVITKTNESGLSKIEGITYALTKDSSALADTELESRRADAMTKLEPYTKKSGIVGIRANMLAAEIAFERKDWANAKTYWDAAAAKGKKSYTASLAEFNAAVCCENMSDLDGAVANYEKAANAEDNLMAAHAWFSLGRVKEAKNDFTGAADAYKKLNDKSPDDSWAHLAKSRLIALKAEGKIQ